MLYEMIQFTNQGGIARLLLNRPDKANCMSMQMHAEIRNALADVSSSDARVLLLSGVGRAFCAGQDLSERVRNPGEAMVDLGESIEKNYIPLLLTLRALEVPVVAAVNGVAAGAGCNLALACDLVIACRSASFIQSFCKLGLMPDAGGTWTLPRLVGTSRALGLALLGDRISASQAADWGMIWRCVEDVEFPNAIEGILNTIATSPTRGLVATKRAIYGNAHRSFEEALNVERDGQRSLGFSADYSEGLDAFFHKRPPNFTGR